MREFGWLQLFAEGESPAAEGEAVPDGDGAGRENGPPGGVTNAKPSEAGSRWQRKTEEADAQFSPASSEPGETERSAFRLTPDRDGTASDSAREAMLRRHFAGMLRQAERLREVFPDFDLHRELEDPEFLRRTLPESGMSVEDAFYSLHHGEILRRQAEAVALRSRADAAAALRLGERPRENGSSANAAALGAPDLRHMSRRDKIAYIRAKYPSRD